MPPFSSAFLPLLDTLPFFAPDARAMRHKPLCHSRPQRVACAQALLFGLVCKTVRIFAYSSTREQSNKRSEKIIKKKKKTRLTRVHARRARKTLLHHALLISLLIFRKKKRLFCSLIWASEASRTRTRELAAKPRRAAEGPHLLSAPARVHTRDFQRAAVWTAVSAVISQDHAQLETFSRPSQ